MSESNKFTPGPWVLGGKDGDKFGADGYIYCNNSIGSAIAICYGDDLKCSVFSRSEEVANAKLIAAAPDLLEALENLLKAFDGAFAGAYGRGPLYIAANSAINKARGKQ